MRNQLNLNNILDSLSSLAILLVSGLLIWTFFTGNPQPPPTERLSGEILEASQYWPVQGDSNLAIIEFVDFECPYCKAHTMDLLHHLQ